MGDGKNNSLKILYVGIWPLLLYFYPCGSLSEMCRKISSGLDYFVFLTIYLLNDQIYGCNNGI